MYFSKGFRAFQRSNSQKISACGGHFLCFLNPEKSFFKKPPPCFRFGTNKGGFLKKRFQTPKKFPPAAGQNLHFWAFQSFYPQNFFGLRPMFFKNPPPCFWFGTNKGDSLKGRFLTWIPLIARRRRKFFRNSKPFHVLKCIFVKDFEHFRGQNPKNFRLRRAFPLFFKPRKKPYLDPIFASASHPPWAGGARGDAERRM